MIISFNERNSKCWSLPRDVDLSCVYRASKTGFVRYAAGKWIVQRHGTSAKYLLVVRLYGNLSTAAATSEINENVESIDRFLTTNRNIELLESYEEKLSCTVLGGEGDNNALDLPDIQRQGDSFVESPIILFTTVTWYLRIYKDGKYCTFFHAVKLLSRPYADIFAILTSYPPLENYFSPFMGAWQGRVQDQLQDQITSAKVPLSRMILPQLYWVMTGDDFTLDLNNPKHPKILCVGDNPDGQNIYPTALDLYDFRIVKLIDKKGQLKSPIIIGELPTICFQDIDNLIVATRSNKVAACLGFQDFSQLTRDYDEKETKVIQNTVGNIFSGQVVGETAKSLSEQLDKILQQRQSISINRWNTFTSINAQLGFLISASKIANLSQGTLVGSTADNFGKEIEQKVFHTRIIVDNEKMIAETRTYKEIPVISEFKDEDGSNIMQQQTDRNYSRIRADVLQIIEEEMARITSDPDLRYLIPQRGDGKKDEQNKSAFSS